MPTLELTTKDAKDYFVFFVVAFLSTAALGAVDRLSLIDAARNADTEAIRRLFGTVPATLLGVLALVRYAAECDAAGDDIWMVYMTDEDEPVYGYQALFASVIAALEKL